LRFREEEPDKSERIMSALFPESWEPLQKMRALYTSRPENRSRVRQLSPAGRPFQAV